MNKTINSIVAGVVLADGVSKFKTSNDELEMLLDYMNTLDKDAAAREAHAKDPQEAMRKYGLTAEERAAVVSGNMDEMMEMLGGTVGAMSAIRAIVASF